jgi:hypothetical protein
VWKNQKSNIPARMFPDIVHFDPSRLLDIDWN